MPSEGMILTTQVHAGGETEGPPWGHLKFSGVVTKKAGAVAVKAPDGSTYQLNPNASQRHGHEPFKEGHEVTVLLNENNAVIDVHPKGQEVTLRDGQIGPCRKNEAGDQARDIGRGESVSDRAPGDQDGRH